MKKHKEISGLVLRLLAMAAIFTGWMLLAFTSPAKAEETESAQKVSIELTRTKPTLTAGRFFTFRAKVSGTEAPVIWSVSDEDKASITNGGKLTGIRAGKVTVTASVGEVRESIDVAIKGKKKIAIDAGHQGKGNSALEPIGPGAAAKKPKVASGTQGAATKVPEYKLTLAIALRLKDELLDRGYEVYMIRETHDVDITNKERAVLANKSGSDICIRLHADGSSVESVRGASALYPSSKNPYVKGLSKESKRLSQLVLDAMCEKSGAKNRGLIIRDDLTGTNWSKIPVTLIEMGYMTNRAEDRRMQEEEYQQKLAFGMADGIDAYFQE